jgi:hypothetical protein
MSGLLSIAPLVETVEVSGQKVSVPGVGLRGVASLFQRFPALRSVFQGGANLDDLVSVAPDAVAASLPLALAIRALRSTKRPPMRCLWMLR